MKLLKLPFKLLALPLMLILYTVHILGKLASNISAYVIGLVMAVFLVCGIYMAINGEWLNVAIIGGIEFACVILQFSAMSLTEIVGAWAGGLVGFLRS